MSPTMFASNVEPTVENLKAAYQGEMNARARYLAFAARADKDGYPGIASLFRAAARAEQIHANNQARVLRQLGAEATVEPHHHTVGETLDNLRTAIAGENFEIETMYPAFVDAARASINASAARCFEWSLEAEKGHARLYGEAFELCFANVTDSWIGAQREFYVCPVCACTSEIRTQDNCGICQYPAERLEAIC
ncbi:MAG: rubrerythrin family protein [Terracidiphilus sp.]|nr:rubrerythrin family protein [Terracidiphilus sp.]